VNLLDKFFNIKTNLESIGLIVDKEFGKYFCTPEEAIVFAHSGVDGIHYCIIPKEDDDNLEKSPVYVINPMDSDHYVDLIGRNLIDFLSLIVSCKGTTEFECANYMTKDKFVKYINEYIESIREVDEFNQQVEEAIKVIKNTFNISQINDVYDHLKLTKNDLEFNVKFSFTDKYYEITGEPRK
jgi:hypothetical protein